MGLGEANCRVCGERGRVPKGKGLGFIQIPREWAEGVMLLKDQD